MIRIFFIIFVFIIYGNINYQINDLIILSLINIALFSILKEKRLRFLDFLVYILSTLTIEILVGLPLFISSSLIILPILLLSYLLNNLSMHYLFTCMIIFISSLFLIFFLDQSILYRAINIQYFISIIVIFSVYIGLKNYGKE